jgi:hypothetical protein
VARWKHRNMKFKEDRPFRFEPALGNRPMHRRAVFTDTASRGVLACFDP